MKITLKEFFENEEDLAIRCDTEEKASQLLKAFDKLGKKWYMGSSYAENVRWDVFKEKTVYYNDGSYSDIEYAIENDIKVYEFEDVDINENC